MDITCEGPGTGFRTGAVKMYRRSEAVESGRQVCRRVCEAVAYEAMRRRTVCRMPPLR